MVDSISQKPLKLLGALFCRKAKNGSFSAYSEAHNPSLKSSKPFLSSLACSIPRDSQAPQLPASSEVRWSGCRGQTYDEESADIRWLCSEAGPWASTSQLLPGMIMRRWRLRAQTKWWKTWRPWYLIAPLWGNSCQWVRKFTPWKRLITSNTVTRWMEAFQEIR